MGEIKPADLSKITQPTLVVNGDEDRMVPTENSYDLVQRLPNSKLVIYEDAGHGSIFQYYEELAKRSDRIFGEVACGGVLHRELEGSPPVRAGLAGGELESGAVLPCGPVNGRTASEQDPSSDQSRFTGEKTF